MAQLRVMEVGNREALMARAREPDVLHCIVVWAEADVAALPPALRHALRQARALAAPGDEQVVSVAAPVPGPLPLLVVSAADGTPSAVAEAVANAVDCHAPGFGGQLEVLLPLPQADAAFADSVCERLGPALWVYEGDGAAGRPPPLAGVAVVVMAGDGAARTLHPGPGCVAGEAAQAAMTLVAAPPNKLQPAAFAARAQALLHTAAAGGAEGMLHVVVHDAEALRALGFGLTLAIGAGATAAPPCVVEARYSGDPEGPNAPPVVLVGKGVTFDSGGISLKPARNMHHMKSDMAGAATVVAAVAAAIRLRLPVNVVALAGMIENMPDGRAARPGDVARSVGGTTVEIINTDAEGRLVMADLLQYSARLRPRAVVDVATLTGACVVALGHYYGGLFTADATLRTVLLRAARASGNNLWAMPMGTAALRREMRSEVADLQNVNDKVPCGHIYAAAFLQKFAPPDTPWAHIDGAGVMYDNHAGAHGRGRPTGWGVPLLVRALANGSL